MQISQLSVVTDVPVPTLKYYLREGLLMPGTALSATRADYDDSHVERVRLLRALIDVGRLSLADAGRVIATLDAGPGTDLAEVLGTAHAALPAPGRTRRCRTRYAPSWPSSGGASIPPPRRCTASARRCAPRRTQACRCRRRTCTGMPPPVWTSLRLTST